MVIRAGEPWGELGIPPKFVREAANEAELADLWMCGVREAALRSGTLCSTTNTGAPGYRIRADIDAVLVKWTGPNGKKVVPLFGTMIVGAGVLGMRTASIVTNSGFWRTRRLVPAAHPNDGMLDVLDISPDMSPAQRWMAWRRSVRLDHLPHPHLRVRRVHEWEWPGGACTLWIDGRKRIRATRVMCSVVPDAMHLWL